MCARVYYKYLLHRRAGISDLAYWPDGSVGKVFKVAFVNAYYLFRVTPFVEQYWIPFTQVICSSIIYGLEDFKNVVNFNHFTLTQYRKTWPFYLNKFDCPPYTKMLCAKGCWNCLSSYGEFFSCFHCIFTKVAFKDFVLYFYTFEFQVHREDLCYVWLKSAQF